MPVRSHLDVAWRVTETRAGLAAGAASHSLLEHPLIYRREMLATASPPSLVYSDRLTISTATTLDLTDLTSQLDNSPLAFGELVTLGLRNLDAAVDVLVGGATSAVGITAASDDMITIGPGGLLLLDYPDGLSVVDGSSHELRIDTSTGSAEVDLLLMGRSA